MSAGWEIGDLAVKRRGPCTKMPRGVVARVVGLTRGVGNKTGIISTGLLLEGWDSGIGLGAWSAYNFDKIKPDTEPCEQEFTVLIKRGRKVQA